MEMDKKIVALLLVVLGMFFAPTDQSPFPYRALPYNETYMNNKTIAEMVQHQTDTIKHIVSNHHRPQEHPLLPSHPSDDHHQHPTHKLTLEELKTRCKHLEKLLNATSPPPPTTTTPTPTSSLRLNGYYITTETPPTTKPPPQNVKMIKLEPVILQKTILSDGNVVYYWHKSLPSQVQIVPSPAATTTTTTTTSGYGLGNFFPFYSFGGSEPSATEKAPTAADQSEVLYQQQLKFVVPVPWAPPQGQFDYYPQPLQPEPTGLEVPYVPTYHVIKAVAVPSPKNVDE